MRAALGPEHIVMSQPVVGEKADHGLAKPKVYMIQPFIDGWSGKTLPDSVRKDKVFVD